MSSDVQQAPFVKQLAANDRPTRDKAVTSLRTYLSGSRTFSELELLKLWKGLFFCSSSYPIPHVCQKRTYPTDIFAAPGMWMSDRPRTQQRLVVVLAGLVDVLSIENALPFLEAFWVTMAREWNGIDVLRMDKFLLLIRSYLSASFRYIANRAWSSSLVERYIGILTSLPLSPSNGAIPNGLRYHVIDIYIDELDKADTPRGGSIPLLQLVIPLKRLEKDSKTKEVRVRAKEALADRRLVDWEAREGGNGESSAIEEEEGEEEWGGIDE
ncbi:MAG: hypothetical protein M1827_003303 [Pycnora praestabilis]|nr:MAG: hypothetical protein M1827_003303 [Pycnora praestabilis]